MASFQELLYPLGFISTFFFGLRTLSQWGVSEVKKRSSVPKIFWQFSLAGNLSLLLHSLIQLQYHVSIVQALNAIISIRNLDLLKGTDQRLSFKSTLFLGFANLLLVSLYFNFQTLWFEGDPKWFRSPFSPLNFNDGFLFYIWHGFGVLGLFLFNSRFWYQWWRSEKNQESTLDKTFWQISFIGSFFCLFYFLTQLDMVNAIGPAGNLIPILRNLMLIKKEERVS